MILLCDICNKQMEPGEQVVAFVHHRGHACSSFTCVGCAEKGLQQTVRSVLAKVEADSRPWPSEKGG